MRNQEIAHLFAAQTRHAIEGGNLSFVGKTLYSYAEPIAKIIAPNVVLMNSHNFSMTTNRHMSYARQALSHFKQLYTPKMHNPVAGLLYEAAEYHAKAILPRIKLATAERHLHNAQEAYENARELARYLKQPMPRKRTFTLENAPWKAEAERAAKEYRLDRCHADFTNITMLKHLRKSYANALHYNPKAKLQDPPSKESIQALQREHDLGKWAHALKGNHVNLLRDMAQTLHAKDTPEERVYRETIVREKTEELIQNAFEQMENATNHYALNNLFAVIPESHEIYPKATLVYDERSQKIRAESEATNAEKISKWRDHTNSFCPRTPSALLRLSKDRLHVETSWGARVPASLTSTVYTIVKRCRDHSASLAMNQTLGDYRWTHTNAQGGITVGCHDIRFEEIEGIFNAIYG